MPARIGDAAARALARAMRSEVVAHNVASLVKPPKVDEEEVEILKADQIATVLKALEGHPLHCLVVLALSSGARRGELLALTWENIDFGATATAERPYRPATLTITRSLEQTRAGLRFKPPKARRTACARLRSPAAPWRRCKAIARRSSNTT